MFHVHEDEIILRVMTDDAFVKPYPHKPPIPWPGVTIQDIRLAYRIEKVWESYWAEGKAELPQTNSKFPGRRVKYIRLRGIMLARLFPKKLRRRIQSAAGRIPKPVLVDGHRRPRKKQKTPRWKRWKWRNQARRDQKREREAAAAELARRSAAKADVKPAGRVRRPAPYVGREMREQKRRQARGA